MKSKLIITLMIFCTTQIFGQQSISDILVEIEKNNLQFQSHQKRNEASALGNRTGIFLQNPTIDFAWYSGSPASIGSKTNLSVLQSFHFPTAYRNMSQIAAMRNRQLDTHLAEQRIQLLTSARLVCLNLIYARLKQSEWETRLDHAQQLARAWERMLETGQISQLDYNKIHIHLLNTRKELESIAIEQLAYQNKLAGLNGGKPINFSIEQYPAVELERDFEAWFRHAEQKNTALQWIRQEVEISRQQEQLKKAMNLPSFHAGYVSEVLANEQFRGISFGISIPMWENKNTLKYARASTMALESEEVSMQNQFYNHLKSLHTRASSLAAYIEDYKRLLQARDNTPLLQQAFEAGEMNITEYLLELSYLYQSRDKILETELELHLTLALLNQYLN